MPDVFTKAKRSDVMSRIKGRGNKETELALAICFDGIASLAGAGIGPFLASRDFIFPNSNWPFC